MKLLARWQWRPLSRRSLLFVVGATALSNACSSTRVAPSDRTLSWAPEASPSSAPLLFQLPGPDRRATVRKVKLPEVGIDAAAMDRSVNACEDLYRLACGSWLKTTDLRPDETRREMVGSAIVQETRRRLRDILESSPSKETPETVGLRDFYRSCMDEAQIDKRGATPLDGYLRKINAASTREDIARVTGDLHPIFDAFFFFSPTTFGTERRFIINGGGISGLSRANHLGESTDDRALRDAYVAHAEKLLALARFSTKEAHSIAADAMKIQIGLAEANTLPSGDPGPDDGFWLSPPDLVAQAPEFPWMEFFAHIGLQSSAPLRIANGEFPAKMAVLFQSAKPSELKHYLVWRVVSDLSPLLGAAFQDERRSWRERLEGNHADPAPRWETCLDSTLSRLPNQLAGEYVERYFPEERRAALQGLFDSTIAAEKDRMGELFWLEESSRAEAREKLSRMTLKTGTFDRSTAIPVTLRRDSFLENDCALQDAFLRDHVAKVGTAPDSMADMEALLPWNGIDLPHNAALLSSTLAQGPIVDAPLELPFVYGTVGAELAGAIMYGFEATGLRTGADGSQKVWLAHSSQRRLDEKTACVARELGAVVPKADAERALPVAVHDRATLELAFRSYRYARRGAKSVTVADGLTEDQQFFVAYAQSLCTQVPATARSRGNDPRTSLPPSVRVNGAVHDLPAFGAAFGCVANPAPCEVW